jgi:hypothetical protein
MRRKSQSISTLCDKFYFFLIKNYEPLEKLMSIVDVFTVKVGQRLIVEESFFSPGIVRFQKA